MRKKLEEDFTLQYTFTDMPIVSGNVVDYLFCFHLTQRNETILQSQQESDFNYLVLWNLSLSYCQLSEGSCLHFFDSLRKLENYKKFA